MTGADDETTMRPATDPFAAAGTFKADTPEAKAAAKAKPAPPVASASEKAEAEVPTLPSRPERTYAYSELDAVLPESLKKGDLLNHRGKLVVIDRVEAKVKKVVITYTKDGTSSSTYVDRDQFVEAQRSVETLESKLRQWEWRFTEAIHDEMLGAKAARVKLRKEAAADLLRDGPADFLRWRAEGYLERDAKLATHEWIWEQVKDEEDLVAAFLEAIAEACDGLTARWGTFAFDNSYSRYFTSDANIIEWEAARDALVDGYTTKSIHLADEIVELRKQLANSTPITNTNTTTQEEEQ